MGRLDTPSLRPLLALPFPRGSRAAHLRKVGGSDRSLCLGALRIAQLLAREGRVFLTRSHDALRMHGFPCSRLYGAIEVNAGGLGTPRANRARDGMCKNFMATIQKSNTGQIEARGRGGRDGPRDDPGENAQGVRKEITNFG
jgi:hypothetical protein